MGDLRSAPVPPVGADDHVRGPAGGRLAIVYSDFECPFCAALEVRLAATPDIRVVFRHFPVRASHPRSLPAACAAEAAARQGAFWPMHDLLMGDQGRLEDPHLWEKAERLGLDVDRFDGDRRSDDIRRKVLDQWKAGVRAGVSTTPTLFLDGAVHMGRDAAQAVAGTGPAAAGAPNSRSSASER